MRFFGFLCASASWHEAVAASNPAPAPTSPAPPDADQLRAIVPPQRFTDWLSEHFVLVVGLGALAMLLTLVALAVWLVRRRRRRPGVPTVHRTARQLAEERLRRLREHAGELDARSFGREVCDVLRDFLAADRRLPTTRQTSEEFLADAARSRAVTPGEHGLLAEFLGACDQLKFARDAEATAEGKTRLLDQAADFVVGAAADRPPPLPVTVATA